MRDKKSSPFWIFGIHPIREALRAGTGNAKELIYAREDRRIQPLLALAAQHNIPIRREDRKIINVLAGNTHHQGIALKVENYVYSSLESVIGGNPSYLDPLIILDSIQDPQNLGAIIRSSCFFGARGIVIPKDRSAQVTATVIKVASGGATYLPVYQVVNLARTIKQLKNAGLWVFGLDPNADRAIYDVDLQVPLAIVVGNEQKGLRPLVRKSCDTLIAIPRAGNLQSLNAAMAATIALAEINRQRRNST